MGDCDNNQDNYENDYNSAMKEVRHCVEWHGNIPVFIIG